MEKKRFDELKDKYFGSSDKFRTTKKDEEEPRYQDDSYLRSPSMKYFDEPEEYRPTRLNVPEEELYAMKDPYGPVTDYESDEERPKKVRKKRKKKHPLLKILIILAILGGLYLHLSSGTFDIKNIEVSGNDCYSKKQIVAMTDFAVGKNIFISRIGKSTDSIMEDPYFEKASIRRNLPNGITIEVKERKAIGAIARHDDSSDYVIIDKKGVVLEDNAKNKKDKKKKELTQVKGLKIKEAVLGEKLQVTDKESLKQTLKLLKGIYDTNFKISSIEIDDSEVTMYVNDEFYAKGKYKNVLPVTEAGGLKKVVKNLKSNGYTRGTIMVGNNGYIAFSKKLK